MVITKSFNLDINTPWKAPTLYIKQGDADSRKLQATIRRDGVNYAIPGDVFATFRMHKPDDTFVTQDCTISGSVVSVVMDAQCATAAGHGKAEFVLQTASEVVSTFNLAIEILPSAVSDGDIESHDALGEYRTILEEMLRVKGAPLTANTAADMTDTDRVYVYTGSEVGYVNGSWYYYDGDSWVVGGVYNSQAISDAFRDEIADLVKQSAVATESDSVPYLFRPTPNPSAILADEEIVGGTVAHNQLVQNGDFSDGTTGWLGSAATLSASDGVLTVTKKENEGMGVGYARLPGFQFVVGHKYMARVDYKGLAGKQLTVFSNSTNAGMTTIIPADTNWHTVEKIISVTSLPTVPGILWLNYATTTGDNVAQFRKYNIMDLTADYGSQIADYLFTLETGTPGAGVAKLREWGFLSKDYFAYDAGSLKSVNTEGKRVTGKNLVNYIKSRSSNGITFTYDSASGGVTVQGTATANAYSDDTISDALASAYFYALPGTYHAHLFGSEDITPYPRLYIQVWYDDGTSELLLNSSRDGSFTITKSGWIYPRVQVLNGNAFANPVTVYPQIEIGSTATSYVPYRKTTYPTTPTDLNGIFKLDANNNLYADGDVYKADGTITRNYTYRDYEAGDESLANAITDGVHTVVKKNTPTTETADPYTATQIVGKGGTEEWIDNRAVPVPVGHRTQYYIGVPDVPANANAATLKATVSGGKTTLKWE